MKVCLYPMCSFCEKLVLTQSSHRIQALQALGGLGSHGRVPSLSAYNKIIDQIQFKHYYPTAGSNVREFIDRTGEPVIPAVAKYFDRAKMLDVPELTQLFK